jgi:hypothetical protein
LPDGELNVHYPFGTLLHLDTFALDAPKPGRIDQHGIFADRKAVRAI